jgi:N-acetylglucosamine malate deacetylase 1
MDLFKGTIMIVAPHMDDEVLACGGLISLHLDKRRIFLVYVTNGLKSPSPIISSKELITTGLGKIRVAEAISAMALLGVPIDNLHFLSLPEDQPKTCDTKLEGSLVNIIYERQPDYIFMPFRYDRHTDHISVNKVVTRTVTEKFHHIQLVEYFVYHRWKLLPQQDIRKYISGNHILELNISSEASKKRAALDCYTSQTTIFYPWQTRPILSSSLLDEECQNPEFFVIFDPAYPSASIFKSAVSWIRFTHFFEPRLQSWKNKAGAFVKLYTKLQ